MALLTDWYELTMMGGYFATGISQMRVCFEYFFRKLPPHNGYAVLAGLEAFLEYYENLHFTSDDIAWLRQTGVLPDQFLDSLVGFKPSCDVWAIPEGTAVFPHEPLLRIEGQLGEAQLLESFLLNALNYPTLVATKAARICQVAEGDPVIEFGLRRAQGPDGALIGSRAAYIGGSAATSNTLAAQAFGFPVAGTMAHSWIMAFPSELEAFRAYVKVYPDKPILLVDTYDTLGSGVPNAILVFREMREAGNPQRVAIRLDSGDLARLSKAAWKLITEAGFDNPLIVASNDLDEDLIADLKRQGAKINSWGVGTNLITSSNAPSLSGVYKLVAIYNRESWQPRLKFTSNPTKMTDPGPRRVVRYFNEKGNPVGDLLLLNGEAAVPGKDVVAVDRQNPSRSVNLKGAVRFEELALKYVEQGRRLIPPTPLSEIRARAREQVAALPEEIKRLRDPEIYPAALSPKLAKLKEELVREE